ncbi:MAG: ATP-binding protein [Leptolyngbyaceae cyanobacterium bins.59]|nr:ATP-binding protein [Leptolyngbyaceae cyanobacterium bins.59]
MIDPSTPLPRGEILIVDDTPDNLRVLSAMLTSRGFEVRKALNGPRAISSAQLEPPELILLDIKMPEMSGYEVCRLLKANIKTRSIPVIFISALDDATDKVQAFAVGGVDYITKPFQAAEVLARIEHQLQIQHLQEQLLIQNQVLEHSNRELERSNRELEQFAYMVSHDLQQPLQSITGFAQLLLMKHETQLDECDRDYLIRIEQAGSRMKRLIQDILTYAQVGKQSQALQPVDCNLVLQQVLDNLQSSIAEKQVQFVCEALPTILANETQLTQLLQNLISNAIKFVPPDTHPKITLSAALQGNQWVLMVQDNGIGIADIDRDRIFEMFQRVHSNEKYPGTGIGLATCKKIVEHHGGQIWIESELGQGTIVYLSLPHMP